VPAFIEELLFRGVLMGALRGGPFWVVLGLQALAFGAFHVDIAQGMATFILGLGFGFLRLKTRTLLAPMVAHATYNVVVLASMRFMHLPDNPAPNQGLGLVFGGLLLSLVCAAGLQRRAAVQSSLAGPV
jgi:membrane protease YdiL (CAAX protease family)